jgi:phosphoribosylformimino-5-aminoimidazole carboxamide ribotide isomerase
VPRARPGVILYPAIDIRGGHAVRLHRGDYDEETVYDADPLDAAERWAAEGAEWLHVVDLDGARSGEPANLEQVRRIAEGVSVPVQVGGGLRDEAAVEAALAAGAERAVIGTAAIRDPGFLERMLDRHGERIVAGVDARGGMAAAEGWTETSDRPAGELIGALVAGGVSRIVFTPIEVDGTMAGPRIDQLREITGEVEADVIYSGGIGSLRHLAALAAEGPPNVGGVIVGRALYERRFGVGDAQAALGG